MKKRAKTALSGREMLDLYKNNKTDENFDNAESLRNLLEYLTCLVENGDSEHMEVLKFCTEKLFEAEKHKRPYAKEFILHFRVLIFIIIYVAVFLMATARVCEAFGVEFFENVFMRIGEFTVINVNVENQSPYGGDGEKPAHTTDDNYEEQSDSADDESESTANEYEDTFGESEGTTVESETAGKAGTENAGDIIAYLDEEAFSYLPWWVPTGYELTDMESDCLLGLVSYDFFYENGDGTIHISVFGVDDGGYGVKVANDGSYYEDYVYADVSHIIASNNDYMSAIWLDGNLVFNMVTDDLEVLTIKRIINSYYEEEN